MTLKELEPFCYTEKEMIARLNNEDEAVMAILKRRTFLRESREYSLSLFKEQYRAKYAHRNEKETVTMPILYQEDY